MNWIWWLAAPMAVGAFGILLLFLGVGHLFSGRAGRAAGHFLGGAPLAVVGLADEAIKRLELGRQADCRRHLGDCGQRGDWKLRIRNDANEEDRGHQQGRRDRPEDEGTGRIHDLGAPALVVTGDLSCSFSKLLFATTSPGLMPCTWVTSPSATPGFTTRMLATLFWIT